MSVVNAEDNMIQLIPTANDDPGFLALSQRIINGAVSTLGVHEAYVVLLDNWFDHKWLGWWSRWKEGEPERICVPAFNPGRIQSQKHYSWDRECSRWISDDLGQTLHIRQPGRRSLAQPIEQISERAAFTWYSGNTLANAKGSLMLYASSGQGYMWYASLARKDCWRVVDECKTTRAELLSFEERGRQLEQLEELTRNG